MPEKSNDRGCGAIRPTAFGCGFNRSLTGQTEFAGNRPFAQARRTAVYFELDDGEALHEEAPETFYIPPREQRANLQPGQIVKLVFRIEHDETVER